MSLSDARREIKRNSTYAMDPHQTQITAADVFLAHRELHRQVFEHLGEWCLDPAVRLGICCDDDSLYLVKYNVGAYALEIYPITTYWANTLLGLGVKIIKVEE